MMVKLWQFDLEDRQDCTGTIMGHLKIVTSRDELGARMMMSGDRTPTVKEQLNG